MTALDYASMKGNIEIARYLIGFGLTVNKEGYFGATPLGYAVEKNDIEMMVLLIKCGAVMPDFFYIASYPDLLAQIVNKTAA
jgi:ankyrin repeat protein